MMPPSDPNACPYCGKIECSGELNEHPAKFLRAVAIVAAETVAEKVADRWRAFMRKVKGTTERND